VQVQPVFVAVAGDVRAVALLRESLPKDVDALVRVIQGERPWEGRGDPIPDEVHELVATHVREAGERLLARFEEEWRQRDKAVEGVAATTRALAQARVAALLIADQGDDERTLWFGPDPALLATTDQDLKGLGVDPPEEGPVRDVLTRAALGTGAAIRVLDDGKELDEGVGALLRWAG
jgi:hypothetical protein